MTRLTWTIEDMGAFAACNGLTFVPPLLLEHLVDQARAATDDRIPPPTPGFGRIVKAPRLHRERDA